MNTEHGKGMEKFELDLKFFFFVSKLGNARRAALGREV